MIAQLLARFRDLTARERAGLAALAAIAAIYAAISALGWASDAREAAADARAERAAFESAALSGRAPAMLAALDRDAQLVRLWSVSAATAPLARVRAQTEIERYARDAGLQGVRLSAEREDAATGPARFMTIHVEADYDRSAFLAFLRALSSAEESVTPIAAEVRDGENSRFRLSLLIPYRLAAQ